MLLFPSVLESEHLVIVNSIFLPQVKVFDKLPAGGFWIGSARSNRENQYATFVFVIAGAMSPFILTCTAVCE